MFFLKNFLNLRKFHIFQPKFLTGNTKCFMISKSFATPL